MERFDRHVRLTMSQNEWGELLSVFAFAIGSAADLKKRATLLRAVNLLNGFIEGIPGMRQFPLASISIEPPDQFLLVWIGELAQAERDYRHKAQEPLKAGAA